MMSEHIHQHILTSSFEVIDHLCYIWSEPSLKVELTDRVVQSLIKLTQDKSDLSLAVSFSDYNNTVNNNNNDNS